MESKNQPVKSHQTVDEFIQGVKQGLLRHPRAGGTLPHTSTTSRTLRPQRFKARYHTPLEARKRWKLYKRYSH